MTFLSLRRRRETNLLSRKLVLFAFMIPGVAFGLCFEGTEEAENPCCVNGHYAPQSPMCTAQEEPPPAPSTPSSGNDNDRAENASSPAAAMSSTAKLVESPDMTNCPNGANDCKNCTDPIACGVASPFVPIELSSLADAARVLGSVAKTTEEAKRLLGGSSTDARERNAGDGLRHDGNSYPLGGSQEFTTKSDKPNDVKTEGSSLGAAGYYLPGGRGDDNRGVSSGDNGQNFSFDGPSTIEFNGVQTQGLNNSDKLTNGPSDRNDKKNKPWDFDNSENWSTEERQEHLKKALLMSLDEYFRLVLIDESLFKRVHKRYRKIDARWHK